MKNIWTQHLERSKLEDRDKDSTFTGMLHSLVRTEANANGSEGATMILSGMQPGKESYSFEGKEEAEPSINMQNEPALLNNNVTYVPSATETEIAKWVAESQKGYELGLQSFEKDHVELIRKGDGTFILRYEVAGESPFEMSLKSEEEAQQIIEEDNATTEQLYPDNPELQWIKITSI